MPLHSLQHPFEGEKSGIRIKKNRLRKMYRIASVHDTRLNVYCNFEKYIKMLAFNERFPPRQYYFSTEEGSTASNERREVKMGCLRSFYTRSSIITSIYKIVSLENWPPYQMLIPCNLFLPFFTVRV